MKFACECASMGCKKVIELSVEEMLEIRQQGCIIISSDCERGPEPEDILVEEKEGYAIYREKEAYL